MLDLKAGDEITLRLSLRDLLLGERGDSHSCPWARCATRTFGLKDPEWVRAGNGGIVIYRGDATSVALKPVTGDRERYSRMITIIDQLKTGKLRVGLAEVTFVRES